MKFVVRKLLERTGLFFNDDPSIDLWQIDETGKLKVIIDDSVFTSAGVHLGIAKAESEVDPLYESNKIILKKTHCRYIVLLGNI